MNDLISRQAAIDAVKGLPTWWADAGGYYGNAQPPMVALLDPEDTVSAIENLPSAQPEIIRCKECKYIEEHHYEDGGDPPYIKYTCANKTGLAKGYQVHEWEYCSRAKRRVDD